MNLTAIMEGLSAVRKVKKALTFFELSSLETVDGGRDLAGRKFQVQ